MWGFILVIILIADSLLAEDMPWGKDSLILPPGAPPKQIIWRKIELPGIIAWRAVDKVLYLINLNREFLARGLGEIYIQTNEGEKVKVLNEYINLYDTPLLQHIRKKIDSLWRTLFEGDAPYLLKVQKADGTDFWFDIDEWDGVIWYKETIEESKNSPIISVGVNRIYSIDDIDLPLWEKLIIEEVADEYNLQGEDRLLLYVIRKVENGGPGFEFGVKAAKGTDFRTQAQWAAGSIVKNRRRYEEWLAQGNSGDFIYFFAYHGGPEGRGWAPIIGVSEEERAMNLNWYPNALFYMNKWKRG